MCRVDWKGFLHIDTFRNKNDDDTIFRLSFWAKEAVPVIFNKLICPKKCYGASIVGRAVYEQDFSRGFLRYSIWQCFYERSTFLNLVLGVICRMVVKPRDKE